MLTAPPFAALNTQFSRSPRAVLARALWRLLPVLMLLSPAAWAVVVRVEIDMRAGHEATGWEAGPNRVLLLRDDEVTLARASGEQPEAPPPQRTGRIDRIAPRPSAFVAPREVQVWLPPGYETEPERRYPVLYLHDGQNVFDALAAGAEWQADETAQRLVLAGAVAPMIIVAVASGEQRVFDYTQRADPRVKQPGGGAARYVRYLVEELKPFIDGQYRTRPEREATAVGGSSLAALVSLGLLLEHGRTFGAALIVSPAVWWADELILKEVAAAAPAGEPPRLWLDIGSEEGAQALAGARRLRDALRQRGWPPAFLEQAGARHDEAAWAARFEPMLRFLYGRP